MMRRNTRMSVKDMAPRRGGAPDIKYIRAAAITALVGNAVLAALKLAVGIISGSAALLGDGIDSSADVLIAVVTLAVVKIMARPADAEHPWGHARAETVSVAVLSFILFFAGAQLIIGSVTNMLSGAEPKAPGTIAIIAAAVSIAGKLALACSQYALYRRSGSAMIRASAKNMAGDVLISLGVIAGLIISSGTGSALADVIIAAAVGMWVIKTAAGIFLEANQELMDGGAGAEQYRAVFSAVRAVSGAGNPHRARMRRIGGFWDIDLDIEVAPQLTVSEAHAIACRVEAEIKLRLENVFDIVVHVEPSGYAADEQFGISESGAGE